MKESLTRAEWVLMEALWNRSPLFLSELMEATAAVGWNRSSYLTYLKRMGDKGLVGYQTISGNRCYTPLKHREDCVDSESESILSKMTQSSARLLLASMIRKSGLNDTERAELQALIEQLGGQEEED